MVDPRVVRGSNGAVLALRVSPGAVLVRSGAVGRLAGVAEPLLGQLRREGLRRLDRGSGLAATVAARILELPTEQASGGWDIWGRDAGTAATALADLLGDHGQPAQPGRTRLRRWRRNRMVAGGAATCLALVGAASYVVTQRVDQTKRALTDTSRQRPVAMRTYSDPHGHFTMSLPTSWHVEPTTDAPVSLAAKGGGSGTLLVRRLPLGTHVSAGNLGRLRRVTDDIVRQGNVHIVAEHSISVAGLPGYYYLYTFLDPTTGTPAAHAHYFLVDGRHLVTLVFQALPASTLPRLEPAFARMMASYRAG